MGFNYHCLWLAFFFLVTTMGLRELFLDIKQQYWTSVVLKQVELMVTCTLTVPHCQISFYLCHWAWRKKDLIQITILLWTMLAFGVKMWSLLPYICLKIKRIKHLWEKWTLFKIAGLFSTEWLIFCSYVGKFYTVCVSNSLINMLRAQFINKHVAVRR